MAERTILIHEFKTLGDAYVFANELPIEVELLEVFGAGTVLCRGQRHELDKLEPRPDVGGRVSLATILPAKNVEIILNTFYSLVHQKIKDSVLIYEDTSLAKTFEMAHDWLESGIHLHDLKASRVSTDPHILIGTADEETARKLQFGSRVKVLCPLSEKLQSFFDTEIP